MPQERSVSLKVNILTHQVADGLGTEIYIPQSIPQETQEKAVPRSY